MQGVQVREFDQFSVSPRWSVDLQSLLGRRWASATPACCWACQLHLTSSLPSSEPRFLWTPCRMHDPRSFLQARSGTSYTTLRIFYGMPVQKHVRDGSCTVREYWRPGRSLYSVDKQAKVCNSSMSWELHIHVYTYIYIYTCTYMHTYTHVHAYIRTYIHTYIHTYLPTYMNWRTWTTMVDHPGQSRHLHTVDLEDIGANLFRAAPAGAAVKTQKPCGKFVRFCLQAK